MWKRVMTTAVVAGCLTACTPGDAPPKRDDPSGPVAAPSLSGTLYAPAGGDVAGAVVVACVVVGEGCDEARSALVEVTGSGASASFEIADLEAVSYLLMAVKDVDGNGRYDDAGDLRALYGGDGRVTPPAKGLELRLSSSAASGPLPQPRPAPEAFSVSGVALDTAGRPIANALVRIVPALTTGVVEVHTDAEGRYSVGGLLDMPYYARAFTRVSAYGRTYCLRLAMPNAGDYDAFMPREGVVRDFRWSLSGPIPDREGAFFGGTFTAYDAGSWQGYGRALEFAFTATGPRLDGSPGESFSYTFEFDGTQNLDIKNIPVSPYTLEIALVGFDGSRTPLKMGPGTFERQNRSMAIDWAPLECPLAAQVGGNYTWVGLPGE